MTRPERLHSVDQLRGLVMVLMTLDHTRDFFSDALQINPSDPVESNGPLYFTRWITHFCAPVFVLLAGVGAALAEQRGMTKPHLARFLLTRGLWLTLLELTLVRWGFFFTTDQRDFQLLVIWVLGASMVLLAGLQYLPRPALLALSLAVIGLHNLLDAVRLDEPGPLRTLWCVLHQWPHEFLPLGGVRIFPAYKLVPWFAVMALGYAMGPLFPRPQPQRRATFLRLGAIAILGFLLVRGLNLYGDPEPWARQADTGRTLMAFLNCAKYPPSLCYLLMTLGPAFVLLAAFDRAPGWLGRRLIVIGRVPLFFYLLHLPLIHGLAVLASWLDNGAVDAWLFATPSTAAAPPGYGYPLWTVYLVWLLVVLLLYPPCAGFAALKKKHPGGLLSYL